MDIRIHSVEASSFVDGPGERTVVFFQGCPLACPGCQNQKLWPKDGGSLLDVADLARTLGLLSARHGNVTISGGEALTQPVGLALLVNLLKQAQRVQHIILYTGYSIEELCLPSHPAYPFIPQILSYVDVLVDGRFIAQLDDPYINWRGSRNQRVIDVRKTLKTGELALLDWDSERVIVAQNGSAFMPVGLASEFAEVGNVETTRRCGER